MDIPITAHEQARLVYTLDNGEHWKTFSIFTWGGREIIIPPHEPAPHHRRFIDFLNLDEQKQKYIIKRNLWRAPGYNGRFRRYRHPVNERHALQFNKRGKPDPRAIFIKGRQLGVSLLHELWMDNLWDRTLGMAMEAAMCEERTHVEQVLR